MPDPQDPFGRRAFGPLSHQTGRRRGLAGILKAKVFAQLRLSGRLRLLLPTSSATAGDAYCAEHCSAKRNAAGTSCDLATSVCIDR